MLSFLNNKTDCTGCSACATVCPVRCITMTRDPEGFLYPVASDACIHCGKCERVCPSVHRPEVPGRVTQKAYAALSNDYTIWRRSASGGAFSELCRVWGGTDPETVFGGAAWKGLTVEERIARGVENIAPLCKSKYVESSAGNIYAGLKEEMQAGRRVLFCGTPCQVAALRNVLGKEYENLLLIDLICHGSGSPAVFADCMGLIGRQFGGTVLRYEFRAKRGTYEQDHITRVTLSDSREIDLVDDPYMQLFLTLAAVRPGCVHACPYRNTERMGDITIADFKGLNKLFPELTGEDMNYSTVVANTKKGAAVCEMLHTRMKMMDVSVENIIRYNPLFARDTCLKNNRDAFFEAYTKEPEATLRQYTHDATVFKRGLKRRAYDRLPVPLRRLIRKLQGK